MSTEIPGQQHRSLKERITRSAISHLGWENVLPIYNAMEYLPKRVPVKEILGSVGLAATPTLAFTIYDSLVPDSHIVTVAEAQPNLAEICRTGYRLTVRDYTDKNSNNGYDQGVDEPGNPVKGAKIRMQVHQKDVQIQVVQSNGRLTPPMNEVATDEKGIAEFNMPALSCDSDNVTQLTAVANVTHADGRKLAITTYAKNNERQTAFLWFPQTDRSSQAISTPTSRPAVPSSTPVGVPNLNPDNKPAVSVTPSVASTAPSTNSTQGSFNLSDGIKNVTEGVSAIVNGVDGMTKALQGQHDMRDAAGRVDALTNQVTELTNGQHNLQEQLAQSQQGSRNWFMTGLAGLGLGVAGLGAAGFMWFRGRRQPEEPETPAPDPHDGREPGPADGGSAHDDTKGTH